MPNFKVRSYEAELLDNENIPTRDLYQNLKELEFINTTLGGHQTVIGAISEILKTEILKKPITIVEIGSGGGDNLRAVYNWANSKKIKVNLIGIDLKQDCTDFARKKSQKTDIEFITSDYYKVKFDDKKQPDIIFNSLFCHHFTDNQLTEMYDWMSENSKIGFVICDLHRHPFAYYSIKLLTKLFSKSYLVKNDAALSVLRGFKKQELLELLKTLKSCVVDIRWIWAFRWRIIVKHS